MKDSATALHDDFIQRVSENNLPERRHRISLAEAGLNAEQVISMFESQVLSRLLDLEARQLKAQGKSYYTIGSSGHEGSVALAEALKVSDPAYLHYRSGAFFIHRARKAVQDDPGTPAQTPIWDMLLSLCASSEDPISGGRHKVLGSKPLNVPPQTSTIASHLPKAVGAALAIPARKRLALDNPDNQYPPDNAVVFCNFGDASANHATAQSAFNASSWCAYQGLDIPLLWVCEDNGIGISVKTPTGWIEQNFKHRPKFTYLQADGLDLLHCYMNARKAVRIARQQKPVFLHMETVRLMGHAGADAEIAYLTESQIEQNQRNDPLLHSAKLLIDLKLLTNQQIVDLYLNLQHQIELVARQVIDRPKLACAQEVMQSIIPKSNQNLPLAGLTQPQRDALFAKERRAFESAQPLGRMINFALAEIMAELDNVVVFGEDVAAKGGVYHVTSRLQQKFGPNRVFNSLLDETSILGGAIGLAQNGLLPIPEIQFLAYVHNAEDQIRGEAATLSFFSNQQYTNPMVIRIAGLAYQKGFGGHFHNDNSLAVFRDIPGLVITCPSNGQDAVAMLRASVDLARKENRVVIFIEPIALYMTRDLHAPGDELWASKYPTKHTPIAPGEFNTFGQGKDYCIVTYGNGYFLSRQAEKILKEQHNLDGRIIDLRWLAPLNEKALLEEINQCNSVLVLDECRKTGSLSEALMCMLLEAPTRPDNIKRRTAEDSFIPLGNAANAVLPSVEQIIEDVLAMNTHKNLKRAG
ncbi:thiamine pyrophosphate-dependent enzyme [Litoribacillus peritrichatus]|uniref:3-methyl-2-oxobutanoate dehydrogenase (2-methylpropanoyl-transferring) n=1 Tax=Litoribacillus peritrichatus TaxID=718191 RepID=A0ABP7M8X7_9GAMM